MACALALDLVAEALRSGRWAPPRRERLAVDLGDDAAADDLAWGGQEAALGFAGGGVGLSVVAGQSPGCAGEYYEALRGAPMSPRYEGKPNGQDP
jgi:hypothetical protein